MGPQKKKNKLLWAAVFVIWALAVGVVVYFSLTRAVSAGAKRLLPTHFNPSSARKP